MIHNTIWNHLFHPKKMREVKANLFIAKKAMAAFESLKDLLNKSESLLDLLEVHKIMWAYNYRNKSLGPNKHGTFRTSDIASMLPSEVYLGNIYGIFTKNISYWEKHKDDVFGVNEYDIEVETTLYSIVYEQYRKILYSNLLSIFKNFARYKIEAEFAGF